MTRRTSLLALAGLAAAFAYASTHRPAPPPPPQITIGRGVDHPRCFAPGTLGVENFFGCPDAMMNAGKDI